MRGAVAYIMKGFPRLSETFIANEVRLLSQYGIPLGLFSIKPGDTDAQAAGLPGVTYAPRVDSLSSIPFFVWLLHNLRPFLASQALLFTHPVLYLRTLKFAVTNAVIYRRWSHGWLKKTFVKEFLLATWFAREIYQAGRFTHLHAHFCHDVTNVTWMISMLTGLPFSFTAHAKDIYQHRQNPGDLLPRKIAASCFVVTCTESNVEHLRRLTATPGKIHGIYHGLDLRLFTPAFRSPAEAPPRLLAVGRHVAKKGFRYLLSACAELRDRGFHIELHIIGESGEETETLRQLIRDLRLGDRVCLLAPVAQRDLVAHYRAAMAFVLPCIVTDDGDRDGIPNVIAEAMASGVPVVATGISGIPEIVMHDVNGLIVPPRNSLALADAIERLLGDVALRSRLGAAGWQRIEAVFDAARTHRKLTKLFRHALDGTEHVYG